MYLFVFHSLFLLAFSAAAARRLFSAATDRVLATATLAWANIVVTCLLLAGLHRLGEPAWFLRTSLVLAAATWVALRRTPAAPPSVPRPEDRLSPWLVAILAATIAPVAYFSLRIAGTYVPNNYDSLAYHLPRAMFYLGQNSLAHFDTGNDRQIFFPFNFTLLQLFGLIYGPPLQALNFLNLGAWAAAGVAVYRLARLAACSANASLVAAWLALTSTQILAQGTATTNDLPTGVALLAALVFGLRWRQTRLRRDALLCGVAAGLAGGSKLTVIFFAPAAGLIGLALAVVYFRRRETGRFLQEARAWLLPAILAAALTAPFALINLAAKGAWVTKTYDYTLNRPFSFASAGQTVAAYLVQIVLEPLHRFTFDLNFTERLNAWGEQTLFPHWNPAYAFSPLYLFPPDLNEDHVFFGFAGSLILFAGLFCLVRLRRIPAPLGWLSILGLGWFATYCLLNKWSLYNQRYFVLPMLVLSPCLGGLIDAWPAGRACRRTLQTVLALVGLSALWMCGIYLFRNSSRPYGPLWAGHQAPPALPVLPGVMAERLAAQPRVNIDSTDGNERIFLLMTPGRNQRFTASAHVQPDAYNVFSEWGFVRKVAYSNIEQRSSFTILHLPAKRTAGVEYLGTIGSGQPALDYYGLVPHPEQVAAAESDRNVLVWLGYAPREPGRYSRLHLKVAGLNEPDQMRLHVDVEFEDRTTETLATFTTTGERNASVTRPFRRFIIRAEDRVTGEKRGVIDIAYLFRNLPPEIEAPDDPNLIFADELILPKPSSHLEVTGLATPEGPYPQWNLPLIRWAKAPVVRLVVPETDLLARLELSFGARLEARHQGTIDVVLNGEVAGSFRLQGSSNWTDSTVRLVPRPGPNVIELRNVVVENEPDWLDYLARYPDVKAFVESQHIPLEQGARAHWENFGRKETRTLLIKRHTETLADPAQLYYVLRSLRLFGYRNP